MRGSHFNSGVEYTVEVQGESWNQGDKLQGNFELKKHNEGSALGRVGVALAFGDTKKIKKLTDDAFEILESEEVSSGEWDFELAHDCYFSDKKGSLYLIYGDLDKVSECGKLELKVDFLPLYKSFLQVFETFLRFTIKEAKNTKSQVDIKLLPSSAKEFSNIDSLNCLFSLKEESLVVEYHFSVQKLEYGGEAGVKATKKKVKVKDELSPKEYLEFGAFNQKKVQESIEKALKEVEFLK